MSKDLENQIALLKEKHEELVEAREEYFNDKSDITILSMGVLLSEVKESLSELLEGIAKKEYFDKSLGETIRSTIAEAITSISKIQPPEIKVTPNINIDLKPLQRISEDISKGQDRLISLIEQMSNGNGSEELMRLITAMIGKQNVFLEKSFQQMDYTNELKNISAGINKRPSEWEASVTEWNNQGRLSKLKIKVTK